MSTCWLLSLFIPFHKIRMFCWKLLWVLQIKIQALNEEILILFSCTFYVQKFSARRVFVWCATRKPQDDVLINLNMRLTVMILQTLLLQPQFLFCFVNTLKKISEGKKNVMTRRRWHGYMLIDCKQIIWVCKLL